MTSILHRLRGCAAYAEGGPHPNTPAVRNAEAADEIERLRELLADCVDRMKRARKVLQDEYRDKGWSQEQINLHANWGMLDTTKAEAALAGKELTT